MVRQALREGVHQPLLHRTHMDKEDDSLPGAVDLYHTLFRDSTRSDNPDRNTRVWLHIDEHGIPSDVEVDKHVLVYELGVRYRDLLTLDPTLPLPFPAAILIRNRALIINLETVRMIICANQCYVLSVPDDANPYKPSLPTCDSLFIKKLCEMLKPHKAAPSSSSLQRMALLSAKYAQTMPYELRALEVALATVTATLESEVCRLEARAYPVVDRLTTDVSTSVLEGVRQVKHELNRLQTRVQRVKQELEEILEDDDDMADMYLARRAATYGEELPAQPRDLPEYQQQPCAGYDGPEADMVPLLQGTSDGPTPICQSEAGSQARGPTPRSSPGSRVGFHPDPIVVDRGRSRSRSEPEGSASEGAESEADSRPGGDGPRRRRTELRRSRSRVDPHEIEDAEDQLENYYVKVDGMLRRLLMIAEHIDANEDLVEIQMDHRRNELVALDLLVSLVTAAFAWVSMIAGFWGMNLYNTVWQESYPLFFWTCFTCGLGAILLFGGVMAVIVKRKLMFITSSI
ncbi:MRS4 [Auxenochlorella protothecoides x Auxenochlorella symbiontica]